MTNHQKQQHPGLRLRAPARYDLIVWLFTWGRPRRLRQRMLKPAGLAPGERVLDVSCGTGSLALLAKEQVSPKGQVDGVDASEEMIAYAQNKSNKARADVGFHVAAAQQLPFEDGSFDVVLNTLALHHLPRASRYQAFGEMRRVLKPGGRALVVDFAEGKKSSRGHFGRLKHRHGSVPPPEIAEAMTAAGLRAIRAGPVGERGLYFVLGVTPGVEGEATESRLLAIRGDDRAPSASGQTYLLIAALAVLVLLHLGALGVAARTISRLEHPAWTAAGILIAGLLLAKAVWLGVHGLALRSGISRIDRAQRRGEP
jgi:ubiquinone/menaquinone biosynthesis C-methylase UbiE